MFLGMRKCVNNVNPKLTRNTVTAVTGYPRLGAASEQKQVRCGVYSQVYPPTTKEFWSL